MTTPSTDLPMILLDNLASAGKLTGKKVLIRADLNVPLNEAGNITEDTRIQASLPAIQMALDAGAAVLVCSHLGRPKEGALQPEDSLSPVATRLSELLARDVPVITDYLGKEVVLAPGEVALLENVRGNVGEKANDPELAKQMAALCDVFVHDAFGTAHRQQASTYGVAEYAPIACAGPLLAREVSTIHAAIKAPARPMIAIVGGAKVSSKLTVLESLLDKVDDLIVGGGIANTFMLAEGLPIGASLVETDLVEDAKRIIAAMRERGAEVPIPSDVVVAKTFAADAEATTKSATEVADDDLILDIGPETAAGLATKLSAAQTIVWNGPVGVFEFPAFANGTKTLARAIAESTAFSIAGGGDTLAAIDQFGIADQVSYISTGGGAFLEMLEGKTLPAIEVLMARAN